jgi:large subunit ribosomal protein L18
MEHAKALGRQRERRRFRVRKHLRGTPQRPRLTVSRTLRNISAQVVDDESGRTLASASTRDKALAGSLNYGGNKAAAEAVGRAIAERAVQAGVKQVRFDRGSCKYHGRVAALAEAARKSGLEF